VVRSNLVDDLINKVSVAVKNSPLNQGKLALAISQVRSRRRHSWRILCCAAVPAGCLLTVPKLPARPPLSLAAHKR
jgi:hypothetical protein